MKMPYPVPSQKRCSISSWKCHILCLDKSVVPVPHESATSTSWDWRLSRRCLFSGMWRCAVWQVFTEVLEQRSPETPTRPHANGEPIARREANRISQSHDRRWWDNFVDHKSHVNYCLMNLSQHSERPASGQATTSWRVKGDATTLDNISFC
jgi:hypothetical protein